MVDEQTPSSPSVQPTPLEGDPALGAITAIVAALKPLNDDERRSVLEYVLRRFGTVPSMQPVISQALAPVPPSQVSKPPQVGATDIHDIRTLKELKSPRSANEMAALVAYYVSELAPPGERKPEINKTDIERYFKSARFKLTANAGQTLVNAKHAGYLDAGSGTGQYKLNPVGYNLVVHTLPSGGTQKTSRSRARKPRKRSQAKKASRNPKP